MNSKLIVNGEMNGEASGNPFNLTMVGTYNPTTKELKAKLTGGHVQLASVVEVDFEGDANGTLGANDTFTGVWTVHVLAATFLGGPIDLAAITFSGDGDWTAAPL